MISIDALIELFKVVAPQAAIAYASIVTIASAIVKFTPTQTDDKLLAKFISFMEKLALNKKA